MMSRFFYENFTDILWDKIIGTQKHIINVSKKNIYNQIKIIDNKAKGKCKKRTLSGRRSASPYFMTRETAVNNVFRMFNENKKKIDLKNAMNTISLFGISAEELSEAGLCWEELKAISSFLANP